MDPGSLQNLHDIVLPPAVPWWPPAPGWYGVLALLFLGLLWIAVRLVRYYYANRYRREALREIERYRHDSADGAARVNVLLKRTALTAYPRRRVAALSGAEWHRFLDQSAGIDDFESGAGRLLDNLAYDPAAAADFDQAASARLFTAAERWLKKHRPA